MAAEQLQQLRDIHVPPAPGWWPPAPGWWLLVLLLAAVVLALGWFAYRIYRQRQPVRYGQRLYADLHQRYQRGEISHQAYLNQTNELIKRVLIHGLGEHRARRASGEAWLRLLDDHLDAPEFSRGPGRALGNSRFGPAAAAPGAARVEELHPLVERLLQRIVPAASLPGMQGQRR
jgi:hypothetical protein